MLTKSTLLGPACWVCGARFKNSVPPGPANREDHHIFPRNAGGNDGPEVSLCSDHHSTIHKIAQRLHAKRPYADWLAGEVPANIKKLMWLATMIVRAEQYASEDPNKLIRNGFQLNQEELSMVQQLQKMTGKSRQDIFRIALRLLYAQTFQKKKP